MTEETRSGEDRRKDYCPVHEERDCDIKDIKTVLSKDIKPQVDKQAGQWTVLMWGLGIVSGIVMGLAAASYQAQSQTRDVVVSLEKVVVGYMAAHSQEAKDGFRRINRLEKIAEDHEARISMVEK